MKQITEEGLLNLLKNETLETNMGIVRRYERRKNMKSLTNSEFEVLKEAEDILFNHVDYVTNSVFDKAFCELHKALKRYKELDEDEIMQPTIFCGLRKEC